MGPLGDCYDNAVIVSFWGRMQTELLDRRKCETRIDLARAIFDYHKSFHNRQRRHSSLGMLTPIEYERLHPFITPRSLIPPIRHHGTRGHIKSTKPGAVL